MVSGILTMVMQPLVVVIIGIDEQLSVKRKYFKHSLCTNGPGHQHCTPLGLAHQSTKL